MDKTLRSLLFLSFFYISLSSQAQQTYWVGCIKTSPNYYLKAHLDIHDGKFSGEVYFVKYSITFPVQGEISNGNQIAFHIDLFGLDDLAFKATLGSDKITGSVSGKMIGGKFGLTKVSNERVGESVEPLIGWYEMAGDKRMQLSWGSESQLTFTDYETPAQYSLMPLNDSTYFNWGDTVNNPLHLRIRRRPGVPDVLNWVDGKKEMPLKRVRQEFKEERVKVVLEKNVIVGTLHYKQSDKKHPLIILIQGSGSEGRDNFYFLQLVNYFVSKGFAAFVYDKRGVGESTGSWHSASYHDLAQDMAETIKLLKINPVVDGEKVIAFGFSQGGVISPLVSVLSRDVTLVVNAMGSATPATEQEEFDIKNECEESKLDKMGAQEVDSLLASYFAYARGKGPWSSYLRRATEARSKKWFVCAGVPAVREDDWRVQFWKANVNFDGCKAFETINIPSLVIYGGRDQNVPTNVSVENLRRLIKATKKSNIEIKVYPKLGHIIQSEQLDFIVGWVDARLAKKK